MSTTWLGSEAMGTLFLGGIYEVGKSTLGKSLPKRQGLPFFSAGDLISQVNGETYGTNKAVADKMTNLDILAMQIERLLEHHDQIMIAGHFCIVNKQGTVDPLPKEAFKKLHIDKIILLEAEETQIIDNPQMRDAKTYSPELISALMQMERKMAYDIPKELNCPIVTYCMTYSSADISIIEQFL